jgi:hypothetical protein
MLRPRLLGETVAKEVIVEVKNAVVCMVSRDDAVGLVHHPIDLRSWEHNIGGAADGSGSNEDFIVLAML